MTNKIMVLLIGILIIGACTEKKEPLLKMNKKEKSEETISSLQLELDKRKARFEEKASDYKKKIYAEGIQAVRDNAVVKNAKQLGDIAPNFSLKNASGRMVNLYEELEKGPVVLTWYRGGWCPYCNMTLQHLQAALGSFKKYNASLLALTPELPDSSLTTVEKNAIDFEVLSDINNTVAENYNIVFKLTEDVANAYEDGFGLSEYNGNEEAELPLAATYVIGQDKLIKYAFMDEDYRNRAEPQEIIDALKKL